MKEAIKKTVDTFGVVNVACCNAGVCRLAPFEEMTGNIKVISPFDQEELIAKMGFDNYMKKYLSGELYPTR